MVKISVLIPVLNRPERVAPLIASLAASVADETGVDVETLWLCSPGDHTEIAELTARHERLEVVPWPAGHGDYAKKINHGCRMTDGEWIFTGADDLRFHPGWVRACLNVHVASGALVIGTNDMGNPYVINGLYSTHSLVHRDWLDRAVVDAPGNLYCELYDHNCPDTELIETARARRMYVSAKEALVEHLHPTWRKGKVDETYEKGRKNHQSDRALFRSRRHLWSRRVLTRAQSSPRPKPSAVWPDRSKRSIRAK